MPAARKVMTLTCRRHSAPRPGLSRSSAAVSSLDRIAGGSVQLPGLLASVFYNTEQLPVDRGQLHAGIVAAVPDLTYPLSNSPATGLMALANATQNFAISFVGALSCRTQACGATGWHMR